MTLRIGKRGLSSICQWAPGADYDLAPHSVCRARVAIGFGTASRLDVLRLTPEPRRQAAMTFEEKARRVLKANPALGKRALAKLVGCSESTAGRLRKKLLAEL